jgi:hypothetical protein
VGRGASDAGREVFSSGAEAVSLGAVDSAGIVLGAGAVSPVCCGSGVAESLLPVVISASTERLMDNIDTSSAITDSRSVILPEPPSLL